MQTDIIEALAGIRGAELAPSKFNVERTAVFLAGVEIAHVEGEGVDLRLSRARLIALGISAAALLDCRRDWTLVDPAPLTADQLRTISSTFASGTAHVSSQKRIRR